MFIIYSDQTTDKNKRHKNVIIYEVFSSNFDLTLINSDQHMTLLYV